MNRPVSRTFARRRSAVRAREGFAMFMALGALVIIGVLVAGSSFITLQETRLGQNSIVHTRAFAAAEYGLNKIQSDWDKTPNLDMDNGASYDTNYALAGQGTAYVRYTRLNDETFWIVSEGRASAGDATSAQRTAVKRVGAILRLRIPTIKANGALTTNGTVLVQGSPHISGDNTDPAGWTGCESAPGKAGLVVPPNQAPVIKSGYVGGTPQWTTDTVASNPETYVKFGDETWTTLSSQADHKFLNGAVPDPEPAYIANTTTCNKSLTTNWGEPNRSGNGHKPNCESFFPIIFVTCTNPPPPTGTNTACVITFNGGRGQGILMVDGDVKMNGNFEWTGLIIITGDLVKGNGNAKINGSLMAANADLAYDSNDSEAMGNITIKYSACGIERAMRGSAQVVQAKERAWAELYD